jgi:hypothetical protein
LSGRRAAADAAARSWPKNLKILKENSCAAPGPLLKNSMALSIRSTLSSLLLLCVGLFTSASLHAQSQAALTFTGGNNTPLTLTLALPVTYTITASGTNGPLFVFQNIANEVLGYQPAVTGSLSYSIDGGTLQSITVLSAGNINVGNIQPTDWYLFGNNAFSGTVFQVGDVVTLFSGSITTTGVHANFPDAPPANGLYSTFIADGTGANISAVPEPGSLALLGIGGGALLLISRRLLATRGRVN